MIVCDLRTRHFCSKEILPRGRAFEGFHRLLRQIQQESIFTLNKILTAGKGSKINVLAIAKAAPNPHIGFAAKPPSASMAGKGNQMQPSLPGAAQDCFFKYI